LEEDDSMSINDNIILNYIAVGLIGLIFIISLVALIFKADFREAVLYSQGESEVKEIGKIKGSFILLLFVTLIGAIVYLVINAENHIKENDKLNTENAINHLKEPSNASFSYLINNDKIQIICNETDILCNLDFKEKHDLDGLVKGDGFNIWNLKSKKENILEIEVVDKFSSVSDNRDKKALPYIFYKPHKIKDSELWFEIIDSKLSHYDENIPIYNYTLKFLEGIDENHLNSSSNTYSVISSANSNLKLNEHHFQLYNDNWDNNYHVIIGLGGLGKDTILGLNQAWKLSAFVFKSKLDMKTH